MSMPVINMHPNPISAKQAAADLLESIALEETALSHILNAEGEKLQKILALDCNFTQILDVNDSVIATISTVAQLEEMLKDKLEAILGSMCDCIGGCDNTGCGDCNCDCDCNCGDDGSSQNDNCGCGCDCDCDCDYNCGCDCN